VLVSLGLCAAVGLLQAWDVASHKPLSVDRSQFSLDHFLSQKVTTNFDEFVPRVSKVKPPRRTDDFVITAGSGTVVEQQRQINRLRARLDNGLPTTVRIASFFYPGWQVTVDDRAAEIRPDAFGLINVEVPAGKHRVEAVFVGSALHRTTEWIALAGLLVLVVVFVLLRRRQAVL
jgi:hypothetical protein